MGKIMPGHLIGFGSVADMWDDHDFADGGMSEIQCSAYNRVPGKEECDRLCEDMSGEVIVYKMTNHSSNSY